MSKITKGQIFDVYEEGFSTFRACALDNQTDCDLVRVVDLDNARTTYVSVDDVEPVGIGNIFSYSSQPQEQGE